MKSKLFLLLKTQYKATMTRPVKQKARAKNSAPATVSAKPGQMLRQAAAPRQAGGSTTAYTVMMTVVFVILALLVVFFSIVIAAGLKPAGLLHLLPAIMMTGASVMALITTIYKTNGLLFGFKDYDLVMSLPVKTSTVIASRLMILYLYNMLFTLMLMVPAGIVYAVFAQVSAAFWPVWIITLLLTPLVPVVLATIIGSLIAWVASHFKRKSGANVVFTVIALMAWMLFCFNMNNIAENFVLVGEEIVDVIARVYPLVRLYMQAVCDLNMLSFAIFAAISLGIFAAFCGIVAKFFTRMNTTLTADRTTSNYKMQALRTMSPRRALYQKEWKRFSSSPGYVMNSAIGVFMAIAICVIAVVIGPRALVEFMGMTGTGMDDYIMSRLALYAPFGIAFFVVLTCPSASSVSLEGKTLWLVKALPVKTRDVLSSKLQLNLVLVGVTTVICATLLNIALRPALPYALMMYAIPMMYGVFTALFGLQLNLAYPNFKWENEMEVVKRGMPALMVTLVGMGIVIVPLVLTFFPGISGYVPLVTLLALVLVSLLMRHSIYTKGVVKYDSFQP